MHGRLISVRFLPDGEGGHYIAARVKTNAGKRVWAGVGRARNQQEMRLLLEEANRRFPNPATQRMEERT